MTVTFGASWCATDLGDYRPGRHTYQLYPYGTLPVLDGSRFTGEFQWRVPPTPSPAPNTTGPQARPSREEPSLSRR